MSESTLIRCEERTAVDVIKAIRTRRSIGKVKDAMPEKEMIEQILESSRWAPNHYKTFPWRFAVLTGEGRNKLGEAYGKINVEALQSPKEEERQNAYEKGLNKAMRAPVVIVIMVEPSAQEKVKWVEEVAATACAVQNMMLTAHALGLASIWRTGEPAYHAIMKETFGISDKGLILGFLYIGYPESEKAAPEKKPYQAFTTWITE